MKGVVGIEALPLYKTQTGLFCLKRAGRAQISGNSSRRPTVVDHDSSADFGAHASTPVDHCDHAHPVSPWLKHQRLWGSQIDNIRLVVANAQPVLRLQGHPIARIRPHALPISLVTPPAHIAVGRCLLGQNWLRNAAEVFEKPTLHPGMPVRNKPPLFFQVPAHIRSLAQLELPLEFGHFQVKPIHRINAHPCIPLP